MLDYYVLFPSPYVLIVVNNTLIPKLDPKDVRASHQCMCSNSGGKEYQGNAEQGLHPNPGKSTSDEYPTDATGAGQRRSGC